MIWDNFLDILLKEKIRAQKKAYGIDHLCKKRTKNMCVCICVHVCV